jgi:hypothetical protein
LLIKSYDEITLILKEIEKRFRKKTIFLSGSAETYDPYDKNDALNFIHHLSKKLIENNFRIVNGFGWGVGSSVINGALESIYNKPLKYSESQLILKPFPQVETGTKKLPELWEEYRQRMISLSGISLFVFGNKKKDDEIVTADGVIREFEISKKRGNICIPIASTGHASQKIYREIFKNLDSYYDNPNEILPFLERLSNTERSLDEHVNTVIELLKKINK